ncbi:MAG TPA: hypothetical protein VFQ53_43260 [Kofleriaceae bacterium]|nr:hypothetical protein [Kofleriaceae bacterium]
MRNDGGGGRGGDTVARNEVTMKPAFFTQLSIGGVTVDALVDEYLHWALGRGRFSRHRDGRLAMGIPAKLTVEALGSSGDHPGDNDCLLQVRRADGIALLRMVQRDSGDGSIFWHNVVRVSASTNASMIEHAIIRTAPRNVELEPRASSPTVVDDIIKAYSRGGVEPRDLYNAKATLRDANDTEAFVRHVLRDRDRAVPILAVTRGARTDKPAVDAALLAKHLRGMVTVAELTSRASADALFQELNDAGFDRRFTCFDGGVRLYAPRLEPSDPLHRHPLWIRTWLLDLASDFERRTDLLAGIVAGRIAEAAMPSNLVRCIQDFDRQERRRFAERVLAAPPPDPGQSMASILAQSKEQISALEGALRGANETIEIYDASNREVTEQLAEAKKRIDELEFEAQSERLKAEALEQQLAAKASKEANGIPVELRSDIAASLFGEVAPEVALRLIAATWPERIIVLESALKSARKSDEFKYPDDALDLLVSLATEYYEALIRGGGDNEARKVFGKNQFAPTENDLPKDGIKRRTFKYKGEQVQMLTHLKIGVKDSVAETLRIHFHWDAKDRKIVIGHCGPHLDFD